MCVLVRRLVVDYGGPFMIFQTHMSNEIGDNLAPFLRRVSLVLGER